MGILQKVFPSKQLAPIGRVCYEAQKQDIMVNGKITQRHLFPCLEDSSVSSPLPEKEKHLVKVDEETVHKCIRQQDSPFHLTMPSLEWCITDTVLT